MKEKALLTVKIVYTGLLFFLLIALFFPVLYLILEGSEQYPMRYLGFDFFYIGGSIMFFIFLLSVILVFLMRMRFALILGISGCLLMGINMFFFSVPVMYFDQEVTGYYITWGYYVNIFILILFSTINLILLFGKFAVREVNKNLIKKTVLELGIEYANLEVREISEACNVNKMAIIDTIQEMIENNEIHAEYFKSSKTVAFNKQANIEEIDNLMALYQGWDEDKGSKI